MKRTARYESRPLNRGKRRLLLDLLDAFSRVKDLALSSLGRVTSWDYLDNPRALRDAMKSRYTPGVPVHLQDQAVFDAVATMRRFVDSCLARAHAKGRVFQRFDGVKRRYAFWLLKRYGHIGAVLRGEAPVPEHFVIAPAERKAVVRFVRRLIRNSLGSPPRMRSHRSMTLDSTLYRVFDHQGRAYVAIASLTKGKRLVLPLRGQGAIHGNIRVVWDPMRGTAVVHMPYEVRVPRKPAAAPAMAVDAGITEVLATNTGEKLGHGYGKLLERLTEQTTKTGKARNTLHQLAKKADATGDIAKASRIRRHNLGGKKLRKRHVQGEAAVKTLVGTAVRQALRTRPAAMVVEDLTHLRGRTKNRKLSRIVSRWARSVLRERLEFRTEAGGSRLETVNAAYTSQTCPVPTCGYVHKDNRHGDRFHCLHCGWDGDADVVAAMNLLSRRDDPELHLGTPKEQVKAILDARFRRRKETP
ncbi:MAG: zinc ribbon domain-containing protein [Firmicutes bacterium]|nr:zinc ribbon domain-containing protein [Bacillota bacterium]